MVKAGLYISNTNFLYKSKKRIFFNVLIGIFLIVSTYSCLNEQNNSGQKEKNIPSGQSTFDKNYAGMVHLSGGSFQMGSEDPAFPDAMPVHRVSVKNFWMDEHEVTNAEYGRFVKATGYKTVAELPLNPSDFPGVPAENLVPGSGVFISPV